MNPFFGDGASPNTVTVFLHFVALRSTSLNSGRFCCVLLTQFLRTFGMPFIITTIFALGEKDVIVPTTINGTSTLGFSDKSTHFIPCAEPLPSHHPHSTINSHRSKGCSSLQLNSIIIIIRFMVLM